MTPAKRYTDERYTDEELEGLVDGPWTEGFDLYRLLATVEALKADRDRLRAALERLSNFQHQPRTEEATLVQIEVEQIAREALGEKL